MDPSNLYRLTDGPRNATAPASVLATIDLKNGDAVRQWSMSNAPMKSCVEFDPQPTTSTCRSRTLATSRPSPRSGRASLARSSLVTNSTRSNTIGGAHVLDEINRVSAGLALSAVFPPKENERFWQKCTRRLAIYLESRKVVPSRWKLAVSALTETLAEVPTAVGGATKSAASAAAGIVREPAKLAAVLLGAAVLGPPLIRAFRGADDQVQGTATLAWGQHGSWSYRYSKQRGPSERTRTPCHRTR